MYATPPAFKQNITISNNDGSKIFFLFHSDILFIPLKNTKCTSSWLLALGSRWELKQNRIQKCQYFSSVFVRLYVFILLLFVLNTQFNVFHVLKKITFNGIKGNANRIVPKELRMNTPTTKNQELRTKKRYEKSKSVFKCDTQYKNEIRTIQMKTTPKDYLKHSNQNAN